MTSFKVGVFDEKPSIDQLPVGKIVNFTDNTDINNNLLAQGRMFYVKNDGLYIRLWLFQSETNKNVYTLGFLLNGDKGKFDLEFVKGLEMAVVAFGDKNLRLNEIKDGIKLDGFTGEDLEGVYWGAEICIKEEFYKNFIDSKPPIIYEKIDGNFYSNLKKTSGRLFKKDYGTFEFVSW